MPTFNASQREAIAAGNPNILISAAAGSGKTTVMVEKIRQTLIEHPETSIAQFLVITFTKDAARNMKDKLRGLLEEAAREGDGAAARALGEIETASISTIHAFCTQLLKEYNDNTGAAMNPRVLNETEKKQMLGESFRAAADSLMGRESGCSPEEKRAVGSVLTAFRPEETGRMVQDLYGVLMGIPEPFAFLDRVTEELPTELWNREILRAVELDLTALEEGLLREETLLQDPRAIAAYEAVWQEDTEIVHALLRDFRAAEDAEEKRRLLAGAKAAFGKAPSPRGLDEATRDWKDQINKVRDGMKGSKGILAAAIERVDAVLDERNEEINGIIREELRGLALLVKKTAELYTAQKNEAGAIDYADMEQQAYQIMKDGEKRKELLARYRYIYVDECQDVSGIQKAIITSLTGEGHQLFMVGDIKQSIYGFRHAEPELFARDREAYEDAAEAEARRIFFMDNYRSCRSVVEAVNAVFTEAMERSITDMDYAEEDHLRCNLPGEYGPVDVMLIKKGEEEADRLEAQSEAAGRYIQALVNGEEGYRYRDIVILIRSTKGSESIIVEHLKRMRIPAMYEGAQDFFGLAEVKAFFNLLLVIDNLHSDNALAGALQQTPFRFTDQELAEIRLEKHERVPFYEAFELCAERNEKTIDRRCRAAAEQLAAWRRISEGMTVPDFVWWLMRETGIYAARGAYPDGKARQANLDALWQRALDGQKAGNMRLTDFLSDLREARETRQADSDDHPTLGAGDNFVRVMTMHRSKGLEFPAVILMDLQKGIRRKRGEEKLRMDVGSDGEALGLYLPAVVRRRNSQLDSQGSEAFDIRALRKRISEETRVLYVAMTRAQEKLCLIGSVKDGEEDLWRNEKKEARIWRTRSMLDMIMPAVMQKVPLPEEGERAEDALWRVSCVAGRAIEESGEDEEFSDDGLREILEGEETVRMYEPEIREPAPLKTSVTTLTRQARVLSEEDSEETVVDKRRTEEAVRTFRLSSAAPRPAFLEEEKVEAVNIGTATHRFLRLINLDLFRGEGTEVRRAVRQEAERMRAAGILTDEEAERINLGGVTAFLQSGLGRRMLKSPEVRREVSFTMRIAPEEPTMVQGIIDCAFPEDGEWVLIDYKTDRDTEPETFVPRHEAQMNWYRVAVERLTGRPVKEMWLFALRAGKAFAVERREV